MTSIIQYKGDLRTECTHLKSKNMIFTDAPIDNHGKGENFSPTDLVATSLASCMITVVAIYCKNKGIDLIANSEALKIMSSNPRRISEINIKLDFSENEFDIGFQKIIKRVAETCPVKKSIHPDIKLNLTYKF